MILFNLKLKKKILEIPFHKSYITSIHLFTKPLIIDTKKIIFSAYSFYFLLSSFDEKFALHNISYKDLNNENITYNLIAQSYPTKDELNSVIQIENGQIVVGARDQRVILFDNKIENGKFKKLFEIKKKMADGS